MDDRIGIYIHVPFCKGKCLYCDFYSLPFDQNAADAYLSAVCRAMKRQPFGKLRADTLYLGGGTPSVLGAKRLCGLLEQAVDAFGLDADSEITLEANPESVSSEFLREARAGGYNRISFGVQSGVDSELAALGRRHSASEAQSAITDAHDAGFRHISADLMLAIPGQTADSLADSVRRLAALPLDHISAYLLKPEPGTDLYRKKDSLGLPDEDGQAELYLLCAEALENAGFHRYEISNFAKRGGECRHNLKYWRCGQYLGVGPAAHSFIGGERFSFARDLRGFLAAGDVFSLLKSEGNGGGAEEQLMLRLRLSEGFDASLAEKFGFDIVLLLCKAKELASHGLCVLDGKTIALTSRGMLVSNAVTVALLEALEQGKHNTGSNIDG